jgi:hypothetical protein
MTLPGRVGVRPIISVSARAASTKSSHEVVAAKSSHEVVGAKSSPRGRQDAVVRKSYRLKRGYTLK